MTVKISRLSEVSSDQAEILASRLKAFYLSNPRNYYRLADEHTVKYEEAVIPFHFHLLGYVRPGSKVCELGCGTAHICEQVEKRGGVYTGYDWSEELLVENRSRYPKARFLMLGTTEESELYDMVISLYTIEHVPNPVEYLRKMWNICRPGGLIGIICPESVNAKGLPGSVFYGRTARRFREKVQSGSLVDAFLHVWDMKIVVPAWCRQARQSPPGQFWINLEPRIFHNSSYVVDADAVHLSCLADIEWWLRGRGGIVEATSLSLRNIRQTIKDYNMYILIRKPD